MILVSWRTVDQPVYWGTSCSTAWVEDYIIYFQCGK